LVVDNDPSPNLLRSLENFSQIDSLFIYSSTNQSENPGINSDRIINHCNNEDDLSNAIRESREGLEKQTAAFSLHNQKEKSTRDLSKESGSFLFFQLFKTVLLNMPRCLKNVGIIIEKM
jgi:hypothetical protein